ncbi:MAG: sigma 54-interacting transcriptional regulator [Phycisphaerales bacterium]|nr:sigma 54-interacting transcriptional regulator [Phycisphaerales bacterium]
MTTQTNQGIGLDTILAHTRDGVFVIDRNRRFLFFNEACEKLTGFSAEEVLNADADCGQLIECRDEQGRPLAGLLCPATSLFKDEGLSARQRMRITTRDGRHRWVETVYTRIADASNQPEAVIGVVRDISDLKEREEEWRKATENLREEVEHLRGRMRDRYGFASIISRSPQIQKVLEKIQSACAVASPVLICGEKGTGKEAVVRTIHYNGLQKDAPFVPFNCADASREELECELFGYVQGYKGAGEPAYQGLFRAADGGTLFIENIDLLSPQAQGKLLRAMQDRALRPLGSTEQVPASPRVIAAVSRPAQEVLRSSLLRDDLQARLSVISIDLPPLRERKEDIPFLVEHFIDQLNTQSTRQVREIDPAVWMTLEAHDWPENVRELHRTIESAFAAGNGPVLEAEEISIHRPLGPAGTHSGVAPLDDVLADIERRQIQAALRQTNNQRSLAAKLLNISRSRLYRRMDALGMSSTKKPV